MHKPFCDVLRARARQIRRLSKWVNDAQASANLKVLADVMVTDAGLLDSHPMIEAVNTVTGTAEHFEFTEGGPGRRAAATLGSC